MGRVARPPRRAPIAQAPGQGAQRARGKQTAPKTELEPLFSRLAKAAAINRHQPLLDGRVYLSNRTAHRHSFVELRYVY